jgi:hypothetical protein
MDSTKIVKSAGASKVCRKHCVQKDKKSCEPKRVESTALSQWLIHGEICTEVCKVAVDAFVLALVPVAQLIKMSFYDHSTFRNPQKRQILHVFGSSNL